MLMKLHAFLERWGVINTLVPVEERPAKLAPPTTAHFTVMQDDVNSIRESVSRVMESGVKQEKGFGDGPDSSGFVGNYAENDIGRGQVESSNVYQRSMKHDFASTGWSDAVKIKREEGSSFSIRTGERENQVMQSHNKDFAIKTEPTEEKNSTLRSANLDLIKTEAADEQKNSSSEDQFLEGGGRSSSGNGDGSIGPLAFQPTPISATRDPVLSTACHLAAAVDPRVIGAAVKAAQDKWRKQNEAWERFLRARSELHHLNTARNMASVMLQETRVKSFIDLFLYISLIHYLLLFIYYLYC